MDNKDFMKLVNMLKALPDYLVGYSLTDQQFRILISQLHEIQKVSIDGIYNSVFRGKDGKGN